VLYSKSNIYKHWYLYYFVYTHTFDGLGTMSDHRLQKLEACLHPMLPLCHFAGSATALVFVKPGVGVPQGLEPTLKVWNRLAQDVCLFVPQLGLLVHPSVVCLLDVPKDGVFSKKITHHLLLVELQTKRRLLCPLLQNSLWRRAGSHARSS